VSSFDAGSISGKLQLDTSGFTHNIMEADGIAEVFGPKISAAIADPMLAAIEAFKELGEGAVDTFLDIAADAENMNLLSQKLGVPVDVFSSWAQFAKTVNVAPEQFAQGIRMLEQAAAEAVEQGNKIAESGKGTSELINAFARVGISLDDLKAKMNDPMALFLQMKNGVDELANANDKMRISTELLGGRQSALIPILVASKDHVQNFMDTLNKIGGVTDTQEAQAAQSFNDLKVETQIAFEGMAKAASKPILTFLHDHMNEIQPVIIKATQEITGEFEKLFTELTANNGKEFLDLLGTMASALEGTAKIIAEIIKGFEWMDAHPKTVAVMEAAADAPGSLTKLNPLSDPDQPSTSEKIIHDVEDMGSLGGTAYARWGWNHLKKWLSDDDSSAPADSPPSQDSQPAPDASSTSAPTPATAPSPSEPTPAPQMPRHNPTHRQSARHSESGDINIGTMHVHVAPGMTDAQIGKKVREQISKAQAQANSTSTVAGSP